MRRPLYRPFFATAASLSAFTLAGCGEKKEKVVYVQPRPQTVVIEQAPPVVVQRPAPVVVTPAPAQTTVIERDRPIGGTYGKTVIVREAPPAARIERRPRAPGPNQVWIAGYWVYDGRQYVWVPGRYAAARTGQVWVAPRWTKQDYGYVFVDGYWRAVR